MKSVGFGVGFEFARPEHHVLNMLWSLLVLAQGLDLDEVRLLQVSSNATAHCSPFPHEGDMDCGGAKLCGVLALQMGTGEGVYSTPEARVHGLWPQVPPYGSSECKAPESAQMPTQLAPCYRPVGSQDYSHEMWFEGHEWEKHGMCAGMKDAEDYFHQICPWMRWRWLVSHKLEAFGLNAVRTRSTEDVTGPRRVVLTSAAGDGWRSSQWRLCGGCRRPPEPLGPLRLSHGLPRPSVASDLARPCEDQIYLSACATQEGRWLLADVSRFGAVCGASSGHCVPNRHGPKCASDADCEGLPGCVRCARSGFCTSHA